VINEFMSWSGCNTTSEFIELMNFGPGPMNIGCYIVTNGTYAVTIPPGTIVQPRQYYILSGQNFLPQNCGNVDSTVMVHLNWNTCNCTNVPIPTTGDGFLKNGGSANEKIILLDPSLNVIDAVSRTSTISASVSITTPAMGSCLSNTFDLTNMNISYEFIGNSTGIDNSFARKVDGDCAWVKTTAISANAPNKTGSTSSNTYEFSTVSASECEESNGSISIQVNSTDVGTFFPMNYTLAYDADSNGLFTANDVYIYGVDSSASTIDIGNLAYGRYRITVASSSSCNLRSFDFFIFNCYGVVLPVQLQYFKYSGVERNAHVFKFRFSEIDGLKSLALETSDGNIVAESLGPFSKNEMTMQAPLSAYRRYRLRMTSLSGKISYSPDVMLPFTNVAGRSWPNPATDKIFTELNAVSKGIIDYRIYNAVGEKMSEGRMEVPEGYQVLDFPLYKLSKGLYYLQITGAPLLYPVQLKFLK
jgi:hypothetical protein